MNYLQLPENEQHILPFYLAMEEYATRLAMSDDVFFMWQVTPTVIFGRNQVIQNEVNIDFCRSQGIAMYRRKSGGGCVFADENNVMMSYITRSSNVDHTFARYTRSVVDMLRTLGLNADDNNRNDILIDGRKVSGNAFYHTNGCSIVHGTMLYDADTTLMASALSPSREKLAAKGIASVQSRITTLHEHTDMSLEQFKDYARKHLCESSITLTATDVEKIHEIEKTYLEQDFIFGSNPPFSIRKHKYLDGVGEVEVRLDVKHNKIKRVAIMGDFFALGNVEQEIEQRLAGTEFDNNAVCEALQTVDCSKIILNLNTEQLINLITE
ncbi:MAG: lipoate--protein ligase [Muribaculaceae bacterium]|nr:lipoate--protein ligase [Muribaculaceae bacterium]